MENLLSRITLDKNICKGKPTIKRKRIIVNTILVFLSAGEQADEILKQYPGFEREDIHGCISFSNQPNK